MHEQDVAIVRALVPVAWADGKFADEERQMLDALLDAYSANDQERATLREYAAQRRTLDDIELQDLSADDRRVLLQHAVLLTFADGDQSADEVELLQALARKLRIPDAEAEALMAAGADRAKRNLHLI
jgi:tellurite resistance protein